jgi:hypothetical protein
MAKLTEAERNELLDWLNKLLPAQFEDLIARAGVPREFLSSPEAAQATRAVQLVQYAEQTGNEDLLPRLREYAARRTPPEDPPPTGRGGSFVHERAPDTARVIAERLDRHAQWEELGAICRGGRPAVVVLYGPPNMDLRSFAQRIRTRLSELDVAPAMIRIPLFLPGGSPIRTAADLEQKLQEGLARELKQDRGTTDALLAEVSSDRPVVVVLGSKPLDDPGPQEDALGAFMRERAPKLVVGARSAVVFFLHTYTMHLSSVRKVARVPGGLPYRELKELSLPSRYDVEACLRASDLNPPGEVIDVLIQDYKDHIGANPQISLDELSRRLAEKLEELMGV